jgi:hypothetical protein
VPRHLQPPAKFITASTYKIPSNQTTLAEIASGIAKAINNSGRQSITAIANEQKAGVVTLQPKEPNQPSTTITLDVPTMVNAQKNPSTAESVLANNGSPATLTVVINGKNPVENDVITVSAALSPLSLSSQ